MKKIDSKYFTVIVFFLFILIFFFLGIYIGRTANTTPTSNTRATDFKDCESKGGLILESYPRQCRFMNDTFTEILPKTILSLEGRVVVGKDLEREYCLEGIYFESSGLPNNQKALMMKDSDGKEKDFSEFIGKKVKITAKYDIEKAMCMALMCQCEDFLEIESIEVI